MKSRMRIEGEGGMRGGNWREGDVPCEDRQELLSHKIPWTFAALTLETSCLHCRWQHLSGSLEPSWKNAIAISETGKLRQSTAGEHPYGLKNFLSS